METPQFKEGNLGTFNERQVPLYLLRQADIRSLIGLYVSELLLYLGFILIFLNNLDVLAPGSYFGEVNWVTMVVFSIGLIINFLCIPYLYFSSFRNFNRENDFWDKETFWILPLFFFGTFFLHGSRIYDAQILLAISVVLITIIHFKFIWSAWKIVAKNAGESYANHRQYFLTLKYLTAYYLVLLALLVFYNPLQQVFIWIRLHA